MVTYTDRLKRIYKRYGESFEAIGLADYPIFNEAYRATLNQKILDHYWNEEIGFETTSLFKQSMKSRMNIIMPYYNELYKTLLTDYGLEDMLKDIDMTTDSETTSVASGESETTGNGTVNATTEDSANTTSGAKALNSTYPQQEINSNGRYAASGSESESNSTSANESEQNQTTSNTSTSNSSDDAFVTALSRQHGRGRSAAAIVQEFRSAIINIDELIIDDLSELFMIVWSVPHAYTPHTY